MVKEEYPRSIGKRLLTTTDGGKHRDLGVSVGARTERTDVVLVGGGIMSATLGVFLKELEPSWNIILLERLDKVAQESTNPWNNAGTGHSALCELNYAPAGPDGTVASTSTPSPTRSTHGARINTAWKGPPSSPSTSRSSS